MDVLFTVDVEIWCDSWENLDSRFPEAFRRYILGQTPKGNNGLPKTLSVLNNHGLKGVFFVEPLFALRFGLQPLTEIVGMILAAGQEVQLHLHTEWVDEAVECPIPGQVGKRQYLYMYSGDEQEHLIRLGCQLLEQAGAPPITAFRAGSFGLDERTLPALSRAGLKFDSSFNYQYSANRLNLGQTQPLHQPVIDQGVCEIPMTVFQESPRRSRHLQLGACSFEELQFVLEHGRNADWSTAVILSHNFELMNQRRTGQDAIVNHRYQKLAAYLDRERTTLPTTDFSGFEPRHTPVQPSLPNMAMSKRAKRMAQQALRRIYR